HRPGLGHLVVVEPGAVVLVPLPDVAVEGHLAVDLELVHVHVLAEEVPDRLHHAWVARQLGERVAVHVRREVGAHHVAGLLAHGLRPALRVQSWDLVDEDLDLLVPEQARKVEIAIPIEPLCLLLGELHANTSSKWNRTCAVSPPGLGRVAWIPSSAATAILYT